MQCQNMHSKKWLALLAAVVIWFLGVVQPTKSGAHGVTRPTFNRGCIQKFLSAVAPGKNGCGRLLAILPEWAYTPSVLESIA